MDKYDPWMGVLADGTFTIFDTVNRLNLCVNGKNVQTKLWDGF